MHQLTNSHPSFTTIASLDKQTGKELIMSTWFLFSFFLKKNQTTLNGPCSRGPSSGLKDYFQHDSIRFFSKLAKSAAVIFCLHECGPRESAGQPRSVGPVQTNRISSVWVYSPALRLKERNVLTSSRSEPGLTVNRSGPEELDLNPRMWA